MQKLLLMRKSEVDGLIGKIEVHVKYDKIGRLRN